MKDIAVLDACILYGAYSRDLLFTFMEEGLYVGILTDRILGEYGSSLRRKRPNLRNQIDKSLKIIKKTFPLFIIDGYQKLEPSLLLPDPDDRHVLAAAIYIKAQVIVTHNLKDFPPEYLNEFDIYPTDPDNFLSEIIRKAPQESVGAFKRMIKRYNTLNIPLAKIFQKLEKDKLVKTVQELTYAMEQ